LAKAGILTVRPGPNDPLLRENFIERIFVLPAMAGARKTGRRYDFDLIFDKALLFMGKCMPEAVLCVKGNLSQVNI
jgi:hypothetical protein